MSNKNMIVSIKYVLTFGVIQGDSRRWSIKQLKIDIFAIWAAIFAKSVFKEILLERS